MKACSEEQFGSFKEQKGKCDYSILNMGKNARKSDQKGRQSSDPTDSLAL